MKRSSECVASSVGNMTIHIQAIYDQVTYPCKVCLHVKSKHNAKNVTEMKCMDFIIFNYKSEKARNRRRLSG